jgi:malic enzyme
MLPKCPMTSAEDFAILYPPGVAAPCREIQRAPELVYDHTNKANTIAILSDGSRVLGLGDIGPEAGLPVMEGKALLFKFLGEIEVAARVAAATGRKLRQGVACKQVSPDRLYQDALAVIRAAREATRLLIEAHIIPPPP